MEKEHYIDAIDILAVLYAFLANESHMIKAE